MSNRILPVVLALLPALAMGAKDYQLQSPSGKIVADISADKELRYSISYGGQSMLAPSAVSMTLSDGTVVPGDKVKVKKVTRASGDVTLPSPLYRRSEVRDNYNALTLQLAQGWEVQFRAYDDGVAYRFVYTSKKPLEIESEMVEYVFPADYTMTVPYVRSGNDGDFNSQWFNSFENTYTVTPVSELNGSFLWWQTPATV